MNDRSLKGDLDDALLPMLGISSMPNDILLTIANQYLTPAERSRLSSCSRRFRSILKIPLRLKILNSTGDSSLQQGFFVSPADHDDNFTKYILSHENLQFGKKYYFWTFDYERGNRVYLGRHTRHRLPNSGRGNSYYTLGLRPYSPNQFWMITGGTDGDIVIWGGNIGLSVAGMNTKPLQPDSNESGFLSCSSSTDTSGSKQWMVLGDSAKERLRLMPYPMLVLDEDVIEQKLNVHAIAEACENQRLLMDGGLLLFSPESEKTGKVCCDGEHGIVDFYFWVSQGIIYVQARALLFALCLPILQQDIQNTGLSPLANLLEINSARWDCFVYYMAVAADAGEGRSSFDMEGFLRDVTNHPDHTVVYDDIHLLVAINMPKNDVIRTDVPEMPRDPEAIWKFMLTV